MIDTENDKDYQQQQQKRKSNCRVQALEAYLEPNYSTCPTLKGSKTELVSSISRLNGKKVRLDERHIYTVAAFY